MSRLLSKLLCGVACASIGLPCPAQTVLVSEGDLVPGVGQVFTLRDFSINDFAQWLLLVDTDNPVPDFDFALLGPLGLLLAEGQALSQPSGALLDSFGSVSLNNTGRSCMGLGLDGTGGSSQDSGIYLDGQLTLQEGSFSAAPGFSATTYYTVFWDVRVNDHLEVLVSGRVQDTQVPGSKSALVLASLNLGGSLMSETVIAQDGDLLGGLATPLTDLSTGENELALNNLGDVMFGSSLDADVQEDAIFINQSLVALAGAPSPVPGRPWLSLANPELDLNDSGDYVFNGLLQGDFATSQLIVKNGAKFMQWGDSIPAIAPFIFTSFGTGPIFIGNNGDVLWWGKWNNPDGSRDTGLFLNEVLVVHEGVSMAEGLVVDSISSSSEGYSLSSDGRQLAFEATLSDGRDVFLRMENPLSPASNFCSSGPNSTGSPARMAMAGSVSVGTDDLVLRAGPLPPSQFGLFYYGAGQVSTPFGNGVRCVSAAGIGAFRLPIAHSGPTGLLQTPLDIGQPPASSGQILAGSTWHFQAWFRDPLAGGASFDLSDGLTITFMP